MSVSPHHIPSLSVSPHHIPSQLWTCLSVYIIFLTCLSVLIIFLHSYEHVYQSSSSSSLLWTCLSVLIIFFTAMNMSVSPHHIFSFTAMNMSVSPHHLLHCYGYICQCSSSSTQLWTCLQSSSSSSLLGICLSVLIIFFTVKDLSVSSLQLVCLSIYTTSFLILYSHFPASPSKNGISSEFLLSQLYSFSTLSTVYICWIEPPLYLCSSEEENGEGGDLTFFPDYTWTCSNKLSTLYSRETKGETFTFVTFTKFLLFRIQTAFGSRSFSLLAIPIL
jgi:hypothetical protein